MSATLEDLVEGYTAYTDALDVTASETEEEEGTIITTIICAPYTITTAPVDALDITASEEEEETQTIITTIV